LWASSRGVHAVIVAMTQTVPNLIAFNRRYLGIPLNVCVRSNLSCADHDPFFGAVATFRQ